MGTVPSLHPLPLNSGISTMPSLIISPMLQFSYSGIVAKHELPWFKEKNPNRLYRLNEPKTPVLTSMLHSPSTIPQNPPPTHHHRS